MSGSKLRNQIYHARKRAMERIGIDLTPQLRDQLIRDIQEGRCKFLWRQSNRLTVWRVFFNGKKYLAIYDSHRHTIVTFLYTKPPRERSFHYVVFNN